MFIQVASIMIRSEVTVRSEVSRALIDFLLNSWILMSSLNNKVKELLTTLVNLTCCSRKHEHKFLAMLGGSAVRAAWLGSPYFSPITHVHTSTRIHRDTPISLYPSKCYPSISACPNHREQRHSIFFQYHQHTILNK